MVDAIVTQFDILGWLRGQGAFLALALALLFIAYRVALVVLRTFVHVALEAVSPQLREKLEPLFAHAFANLIRVAFFALAAFYALSALGIPIGPLLAGLGIGGIAVGFAAQFLVRDIISGLVILGEGRLKKGERVKIGEAEGVVEDFELRGVTLEGEGGAVHFVPFGEIRTITKH